MLVQEIKPDIERNVLSTTQIQTDVELRLRKAGIKVLTSDELLVAEGRPWLSVDVHIIKNTDTGIYVFNIRLFLRQDAILSRNETGATGVATWTQSATGMAGPSEFKKLV